MEAKSRSARWLRRLRDWARSLDFTLARRFGLATREDRIFFILVALVGVMSGALGIAVHFLIEGMQSLLWRSPDELIEVAAKAPRWLVVAAPAVGGVLVGLIAWIARGRVGGGGMANMIEAVALSGGKIAPKPVIANALAAVATVGAGGSLGREGPMIRLGAMVSSWLGSRLGLEPHRIKVLVGCGAASGMAAIYNVPVGGTLFAMEVILGNFALDIFGPIVASSVISTLIFRSVMGNAPLYAARDFTVASGWEILLYLGLGVVGALASVLFVFGVRLGRVTFRRMTLLPEPLKPLVGLTLVGVMALWVPHVLGPGRGAINLAVAGNLGLPEHIGQPRTFLILLLLGLAVAKLAATALTAGSGGAELKHEKSNVQVCMVQLPGLNTVQFDWNDNEFDRHPQPVAPIFQPELAGRAIAYVVDNPRRNMWVGVSTAYTILGNRFAPWLADWYLAKTGVNGQLSQENGPRFGSNVFEPQDDEEDRGSHGMFDEQAHGSDPWSWVSMHRKQIAGGALAGAAAAAAALLKRA